MAGPDNGSSPPWGGSTNCNRVANSTPCWSRAARLAQSVLLLSAHAQGQLPTLTTRRIGPALIFERLWRETGCPRVIEQLLDGRRFECDVERAVFLTVLHRRFAPGSDRAADKWRADYQINGCELLPLYHLYRAMAWLGEELPDGQQKDQTPFAPRCVKDRIEEALFAHRRDLCTDLQLVFFLDFGQDDWQDLEVASYDRWLVARVIAPGRRPPCHCHRRW